MGAHPRVVAYQWLETVMSRSGIPGESVIIYLSLNTPSCIVFIGVTLLEDTQALRIKHISTGAIKIFTALIRESSTMSEHDKSEQLMW